MTRTHTPRARIGEIDVSTGLDLETVLAVHTAAATTLWISA